MLEIKNLTKIYSGRGGVSTKALDDVSIKFAETGLVFLLGKSGSGKSTLLNVAGGLDEPTEGEVIVKGKSSASFTGSDFDSYRNTFVGFIFQEYNILDEFNVEDNVALALELQGKPKDKERIQSILRDVELETFAKRKPNTLSGGQKQRIAIARALVKDPQIIMADEPTGALDSATGRQVLETLKKLSETRLVLVVSHDREFAEIYGDRIVELKDGKIISDVTKTHVPPEEIDSNVRVVGGNTLSVRSGAALTADNFAAIQKFISSADGDVIITRGESEIGAFKKATRISDDGAAEKFGATESVETREYTAEQSAFIRSKLPAAKALKIGASSLKLKPVRLVFTIFLAVVAFVMFGLASTMMMYNGDSVMLNSLTASGINSVSVRKYSQNRFYDGDELSYTTDTHQRFTAAEVDEYKEAYGSGSYGYWDAEADFKNLLINPMSDVNGYYQPNAAKFAVLGEDNPLRGTITGEYPQNSDEICVSTYFLETAIKNKFFKIEMRGEDGVQVSGEQITVTSAEDLIGQYVATSQSIFPLKITGVFDSGKIPEKFTQMRDSKKVDYTLQYNFRTYLQDGMHQTVLVSRDFYIDNEQYFSKFSEFIDVFDTAIMFGGGYDITYKDQWGRDYSIVSSEKVKVFGKEDRPAIGFLGGAREELADDEIILGLNLAYEGQFVEDIVLNYYLENLPEGADETSAYLKKQKFQTNVDKYFQGYYGDGNGNLIKCSYRERQNALNAVLSVLGAIEPPTVTFCGDNNAEAKVVGFYYYDTPETFFYTRDGVIASRQFFDKVVSGIMKEDDKDKDSAGETNYVPSGDEIYDGIIVDLVGSAGAIRKLLATVGIERILADDSFIMMHNSVCEAVYSADAMVEVLSLMFLIIGIVLAVFACLLLFNFISVSISNKRKEIGILRAVGARGVDVFKIFFAESGIIVGICTVLALIGTAVMCAVLNGIIIRDLGLAVSLFVFGAGPIAVLVASAVVVAFASTFLPVYLAARKKPVDSIRAL